jgi:hypothetical protein
MLRRHLIEKDDGGKPVQRCLAPNRRHLKRHCEMRRAETASALPVQLRMGLKPVFWSQFIEPEGENVFWCA